MISGPISRAIAVEVGLKQPRCRVIKAAGGFFIRGNGQAPGVLMGQAQHVSQLCDGEAQLEPGLLELFGCHFMHFCENFGPYRYCRATRSACWGAANSSSQASLLPPTGIQKRQHNHRFQKNTQNARARHQLCRNDRVHCSSQLSNRYRPLERSFSLCRTSADTSYIVAIGYNVKPQVAFFSKPRPLGLLKRYARPLDRRRRVLGQAAWRASRVPRGSGDTECIRVLHQVYQPNTLKMQHKTRAETLKHRNRHSPRYARARALIRMNMCVSRVSVYHYRVKPLKSFSDRLQHLVQHPDTRCFSSARKISGRA